MPVERESTGRSIVDVLDRVLDKGIVIDAWIRVSLVGIDLITVEARVVVASIETFFRYSELLTPQPATVTAVKTIAGQGIEVQLSAPAIQEPQSTRRSVRGRSRSGDRS